MVAFKMHLSLIKNCKARIDVSNRLSSGTNKDRMQKLWPREFDCSTNHLGAENFMMIHLLGLGLGFSVSPRIYDKKVLRPPFVFNLSRVSIVTTSLLRDTTTTILAAFVLQSVLFHSFNRIWVYCIIVSISIYICAFQYIYIYILSFFSHINLNQWYQSFMLLWFLTACPWQDLNIESWVSK